MARRKAGACCAHSTLFILGFGVHKRRVNFPLPLKPPQRGTLWPNCTPYLLKVCTSLSKASPVHIHMLVMRCAACFCRPLNGFGGMVKVTPQQCPSLVAAATQGAPGGSC